MLATTLTIVLQCKSSFPRNRQWHFDLASNFFEYRKSECDSDAIFVFLVDLFVIIAFISTESCSDLLRMETHSCGHRKEKCFLMGQRHEWTAGPWKHHRLVSPRQDSGSRSRSYELWLIYYRTQTWSSRRAWFSHKSSWSFPNCLFAALSVSSYEMAALCSQDHRSYYSERSSEHLSEAASNWNSLVRNVQSFDLDRLYKFFSIWWG